MANAALERRWLLVATTLTWMAASGARLMRAGTLPENTPTLQAGKSVLDCGGFGEATVNERRALYVPAYEYDCADHLFRRLTELVASTGVKAFAPLLTIPL